MYTIPEDFNYFFNEMRPIFTNAIKVHEVKVKTKLNQIKPLKECYLEEFKLMGYLCSLTK